ncbi:MAG: resolvase [Thermostichales cyanobacterium DRC_bins_46]
MLLLGLDPGRDKCGLALMTSQGSLVWHQVVPTGGVLAVMQELQRRYPWKRVILGNQTTAKTWEPQLRACGWEVTLVDERFSSQEARRRYWEFVPPRGIWRWLPWRPAPAACDDIAAAILVRRYLNHAQTTTP